MVILYVYDLGAILHGQHINLARGDYRWFLVLFGRPCSIQKYRNVQKELPRRDKEAFKWLETPLYPNLNKPMPRVEYQQFTSSL